MATTPRRGLPTVFVTRLAGLASGDNQCVWATWFAARFRYDKYEEGEFDSAAWAADHDALVLARAAEFELGGAKVRLEKENWIRVTGETVILTGKPDIVAVEGGLHTIADGKTGAVRKKDWWQALLYTYMVLKAWNPNLRVMAEVVYKTQRIQVSPHEFTPELKKHAFGILRRMGDATEPARTPSINECRFCDIAQCPDRLKDTPDTTPTTLDF